MTSLLMYYISMLFMFAFVYFWFIEEGREERHAFLVLFVAGLFIFLWVNMNLAVLFLSIVFAVMLCVWYIGFKLGWGSNRNN